MGGTREGGNEGAGGVSNSQRFVHSFWTHKKSRRHKHKQKIFQDDIEAVTRDNIGCFQA